MSSRRSLGGFNCHFGLYDPTYRTSTWHQPDERLHNDVAVHQEACNRGSGMSGAEEQRTERKQRGKPRMLAGESVL